MPSVLPLLTELATLDTLDQIVQWCSLPASVWKAFQDALGSLVSVRIFSQLPQSVWTSTVNGLRIPTTGGADRKTSPAESIQLALAWRVAGQAFQMPDVGPLADPAPATAAQGASQAETTASPTKKIKFSAILDQLDETEINTMTGPSIRQSHGSRRGRATFGSRANSGSDSCAQTEGGGQKRVPLRRLQCADALCKEIAEAHESQVVGLAVRWHTQRVRRPRSSQLRCVGGVLKGVQVSALHAQVPSRCPRTGPEAGGDSGSFGGIFRSHRKV